MPRVAIFDYQTTARNPIGGCHLQLLRELGTEIDFTVFAVDFENPHPGKIDWIRIPVPRRPLALLFLAYHVVAPIVFLCYCWRHRVRFDLIQTVECISWPGDVVYSHFCHREYLMQHWRESRPSGLRGLLRWVYHRLQAFLEPFVYKKTNHVIVPSEGLARELKSHYPCLAGKITLVPNPVNLERMKAPLTFDRAAFRRDYMGIRDDDCALVFVALGHFERKGLPLAMEAIQELGRSDLKLIVIGGTDDLVAPWRRRAALMKVGSQVTFVGMTDNVREYLWAADALLFPTAYEVFSLASLEAAAAATPLLVTKVNGIEEFVRPGENGIFIERTVEGIKRGIIRFLALSPADRKSIGLQAQRDVAPYSVTRFAESWRLFYDGRIHSSNPPEILSAGVPGSIPQR